MILGALIYLQTSQHLRQESPTVPSWFGVASEKPIMTTVFARRLKVVGARPTIRGEFIIQVDQS